MSRPGSRQGKNQELRDVSKTLSAERREKLIAIRDREAMKDVLLEKFKNRYGSSREKKDDDAQSVSESVIRNEVDTFVSKATLTEDNLARLERRIRQHARKRGEEEDLRSVVSAYSHCTHVTEASQALKSNLGSIPEEVHYDWSRLDEYAKFLHEQDAMKQKAGIAQQQQKLRNDLDQQVKDAQFRKQQEQDVNDTYWKNSMEKLEALNSMDKQKDDANKCKAAEDRETRKQQLLYEKEIKDAATEKRKQEEEKFVRQIAHEVLSEKERGLRRKEEQRIHLQKVFEENEVEKKLKKAAMDRQLVEDIEYSRKFKEILDTQEQQKQDELNNRLNRQKHRVEAMEKNVMSAIKQKEGDAVERAARQRTEMEQQLREKDRNKADKKTKLQLDTQEFLLQQMQQHDADKQHQRDMKTKQGEILEADCSEYHSLKKKEIECRRLRNMKHREELQVQIDERKEQQKQAMSSEEVAMNRELLKKVDRVLLQREHVEAQ